MAELLNHEIEFRGKDVMAKRKNFKIMVCGAGAIGSNLVNHLCRQGFEAISVIDMDKVEMHNISTQIWGKRDCGNHKSTALKNIMARDVGVIINAVNKKLDENNTKKMLSSFNLVIDAFDNWDSRKIVRDFCLKNDTPCVHAGMSDQGFSDVKWNDIYIIPKNTNKQDDVCDYPLARNCVDITVAALAEVVCKFTDENRQVNCDIMLDPLKIIPIE